MKQIAYAAIAMCALTACATTPGAGVKSLGNGTYSISEMDIMTGNVAEHAAAYCSSLGQKMKVEGNTTQRGLASGTNYAVLVFRCEP